MAKPFKPTRACPIPADAEFVDVAGRAHVRIRERGKPILYRVSKDGKQYLRPLKRWYVSYRDANGTIKRVKGFADLKATEQLANELERKADRMQSGFTDPAEEHIRRPLAEHLKDYAAALTAKGGTAAHVVLTVSRIGSLLSGCGFTFFKDADAGRAAEWLNSLRRPSTVPMPEGETFAPSEVAKLLGITGGGLSSTLKRHRLGGTGNGKARRLSRDTVGTLIENATRGTSPATINHYVRAVRGFFRWLLRTHRFGTNPLGTLTLLNANLDVRHARRELTAEELQRLFRAARASARTFRGLTGTDRYFLYLLAAGTGFRANALANLTPNDFDLSPPSPSVTLAARHAKNRKTQVQPLPVDVADALRGYLAERRGNVLVWGGTWHASGRMGEMLRFDLDAAGIAYAVEGPDGPEFADFHSLRHSFLTLGGRSGIDLRTLQELAGHSTPTLTARYTHRRLHDLAGAVDKLPNLVPDFSKSAPLRMTGTDNSVAVPVAVGGRIRGHLSASSGTHAKVTSTKCHISQSLEKRPDGADSHHPAAYRINEDDGTRTRNHRIDSPVL